MSFLFSLLYAPIVFLSLRYFDIQIVSIIILITSGLWFSFLKNKKELSAFFPLFYILVAIISFFSEKFFVLKIMPLLISALFSLFILLSYFKRKSIILYFAEKFSKIPISEKEKEYIHNSTLFWFFITLLNTAVHLTIFLDSNLYFWLYYSSIGWYFLFIFAGIIQFLHRRYVFLRKENV
ncbi:MAG: hypothetical protein DRG78_10395 [Epsilonproteobacteria bacterium]|nr:MAG: hypothetical protein DRG78_10395 [Campylobacterota bacterium]